MGSMTTTLTSGAEADMSISRVVRREMIVKSSSGARSNSDTSMSPSRTAMESMTMRSPTAMGACAAAVPPSSMTGTTRWKTPLPGECSTMWATTSSSPSPSRSPWTTRFWSVKTLVEAPP